MERNYTKINQSKYLIQGEFKSYAATLNRTVFDKTKPFQNIINERFFKNDLLNSLSKKALDNLSSAMQTVYLDENENIYSPDEKIRYFYFPETAVFSDFKILADGRMIEINMLGCEGITGVSSLLNGLPAANFTKVLQAGNALRIDSDLLFEQFNNNSEMRKVFFDYLYHSINAISQKIICNGFHLIENRLCSWLLMLQDRTGKCKLKLTHEQIALSLGAHRPSITQITKKLRDEKIIDYSRGKIFILSQSKIRTAACPCYASVN